MPGASITVAPKFNFKSGEEGWTQFNAVTSASGLNLQAAFVNAVRVWSGTGGDSLWNNPLNWDVLPDPGQSVRFVGSGIATLTSNVVVTQMEFDALAGAFTFQSTGGATLSVGNIDNKSPSIQTFQTHVQFADGTPVTVNAGSAGMKFQSVGGGNGGITINDAGDVSFTGAVNTGASLLINPKAAFGGSVTTNGNLTLKAGGSFKDTANVGGSLEADAFRHLRQVGQKPLAT